MRGIPGGTVSKHELVFLDADETLFDFKRAESFALTQCFSRFDLELSEAIFGDYIEINKALWLSLERGEIDQAGLKIERFARLFQKLGLDLDARLFGASYVEALSRASFLLDGAEELCAYLAAKYTLAIITNGIRDVQAPRIDASSIRKHLSGIIISEEAKSSKPSKEIFAYACERLGFHEKAKMIIVGDSLSSDIQGGINFGIDTCWANLTAMKNETDIVPTYEIRALAELTRIL
jgi:2-haloacid dehalogenase